MHSRARLNPTAVSRAALTLALALFALPGQAQFKVIGADGKVTYTDREPSASEGKVVPLGNKAVAAQPAAAEPELPFELRQAATKYPVTLYVTSDCLRAVQLGSAAAEAARHPVQREAGRHRRGQRGPRAPVGRARSADAQHRLADPPRLRRRDLGGLPRRRRLSARVAPAVDLSVPRRRAGGRSPRAGDGAGRAARRGAQPADGTGRGTRLPPAASASERRAPAPLGRDRLRPDPARRDAARGDRRAHHPEQRRRAERGTGEAEGQRHHRAGEIDRHRAQGDRLAVPVRPA